MRGTLSHVLFHVNSLLNGRIPRAARAFDRTAVKTAQVFEVNAPYVVLQVIWKNSLDLA